MMQTRFTPSVRLIVLGLPLLLVTGCHLNVFCPDPPTETAVSAEAYTHVVKRRGETLGHIAQWYTGSHHNWRKILANNPGLKVKRIRVGDSIRIPSEMVKTAAPYHAPAAKDALKGIEPVKSTGAQAKQTELASLKQRHAAAVIPQSATLHRPMPAEKRAAARAPVKNPAPATTLVEPRGFAIPEEIARLKEETIAIKIDKPAARSSMAAAPAVQAGPAAPKPEQPGAAEPKSEPAAAKPLPAAAADAGNVSGGGGSRISERPVGGPALQVDTSTAQNAAPGEPDPGTLFSCKADDCTLKVLD